jgi:MHS family proline/betaine transporter-like MFS transporter
VLEWYDFAIYGYFAAQIGRTFFPHSDPVAQVLAAFGIFAIGYVMRPLGGIVTGHIGDRLGRRAALTFSVSAMAVPTFLVGVLPGYATLGLAAPVLLTLLRMVQGLSVGGEHSTAMIFLVEQAPAGRRGLLGALAVCGACVGLLLGSAVGTLAAAFMPQGVLDDWGWRLPFVLGLLVGYAGRILRRHIEEVPIPPPARSPLAETLTHHLPLVARLAGVVAFNAVGFYMMFLYIVSWLQTVDGVSPVHSLAINTASLASVIPVMLASGWLSDRIGRKPVMIAALLAGLVLSVPLLWLMHHPHPAMILLGQAGFVLIIGCALGVQAVLLIEASPAAIRCTAVALGFNVAAGIIGGLTPLAAAWLIDRTGDDLSPAWMMTGAAALSLFSLLFYRESFRSPFQSSPAAAASA